MKKLIFGLLALSTVFAVAGVKIGDLPLKSASATNGNDSIPFVNSVDNETDRLIFSDLPNIPSFQNAFLTLIPPQVTKDGQCLLTNGTITLWGDCAGQLLRQANKVLAGPTTGGDAVPTYRSLVGADLPNPSSSSLGGVESYVAVTNEFITSISTLGVPVSARPTCGNLSDSAASCSIDATNATNITSGTLPAARLPNPSPSTLGGIESYTGVSSQWINSISTSGVPNSSQPAFSDISGTLSGAQLPALSGDVTNSGAVVTISNLAVTNAKIANSTIDLTAKVTGVLPNANTTATSLNTASAIAARDGSGNFAANIVTASLSGNATTATALATNPTDCSSNQYATTIDAQGNLTCAQVTTAQLSGNINLATQTTGILPNANTTGVSTNTPSTLALRDGSGNFAANIVTAALSGNATTATALAANPTDCSAGQYATTIDAQGNLTCAQVATSQLTGNINLATQATGTLAFGNGGTGQTAYTDGQLLIGNTSTGGITKATLTQGTGVTITNGNGSITIAASGSGGTVSSVAVATPASSLFSVSGSPVTGSGTINLLTTGTSGGIPYFDTTSTLNTSGALTNHGIVLGGGAGGAPTSLGTGSTGQVLQANTGAAPSFSTAAYPSTAGTSGTLLTSNGTNIVNTSATYPSSTTANQILYSSATNTVGGISTANTSALVTNSSGVPAFTSGTTANRILTTDGTIISFTQGDLSTAQFTGTLPVARGGTNGTATPNGLAYGDGSKIAYSAGSSGQIVVSGGTSAAPTYLNEGHGDTLSKTCVSISNVSSCTATAMYQQVGTMVMWSAVVTVTASINGTDFSLRFVNPGPASNFNASTDVTGNCTTAATQGYGRALAETSNHQIQVDAHVASNSATSFFCTGLYVIK